MVAALAIINDLRCGSCNRVRHSLAAQREAQCDCKRDPCDASRYDDMPELLHDPLPMAMLRYSPQDYSGQGFGRVPSASTVISIRVSRGGTILPLA